MRDGAVEGSPRDLDDGRRVLLLEADRPGAHDFHPLEAAAAKPVDAYGVRRVGLASQYLGHVAVCRLRNLEDRVLDGDPVVKKPLVESSPAPIVGHVVGDYQHHFTVNGS